MLHKQAGNRAYFNPRPPRGGRPDLQPVECYKLAISIHALRGEGDISAKRDKTTPSISIHALRGEGDDVELDRSASIDIISIHALRGEGDFCPVWH